MSVASRVRRRRAALRIDVADAGDLSARAIAEVGGAPVTDVDVRVREVRLPRGWVGTPGLGGVRALTVEPDGDGARVRLSLNAPADPGLVLAAALRCLRPHPRDVAPLLTLAPGLDAGAAPLAIAARDVLDAEPGNRHLRRCDTLVLPPEAEAETQRARTVVISGHDWHVDGQHREVAVDPLVHRPLGRRSLDTGAIGTALMTDGRLVIAADGLRVEIPHGLTAAHVRQLAGVRALAVAEVLPLPWRAQLEALGIVMSADEFPQDALGWQAASVHARRHALRAYAPAAALDAWPSVSVVLVTHREAFIDHALDQLAKMNYPRLQVVVGLHGVHVDDARFDRLRALHEVQVHRLSGDLPFGSALQVACERADGQLVTKIDDDDHYGAEHVWDLVLARMYSGAELVGKALDWIHVEGSDVTAFRPEYPAESYATFVAGGTLLISKADLLQAGGWRPVPKTVDRALIDSVKRAGGLVYRTHGLGYVYVRHGGAHTATVDDQHFLTKTAQQWTGLLQHEALGTVRHG